MKNQTRLGSGFRAGKLLSMLITAFSLAGPVPPASLWADAPPTTVTIRYTGTNFEGRQGFLLEWNAVSNATYKVQSGNFGDTPGLNGNDMVWKTIDVVTAVSNSAQLEVKGRSIPENSVEFFQLILPRPEIFSVEPALFAPGLPVDLYVLGQCLANTDVVRVDSVPVGNASFVDHTLIVLPGQTLNAGSHKIELVRGGMVLSSFDVVCADAASAPELVLQEPPEGFPPASPAKVVNKGKVVGNVNVMSANRTAGRGRKSKTYQNMSDQDIARISSWGHNMSKSIISKISARSASPGGDVDEDCDGDADDLDAITLDGDPLKEESHFREGAGFCLQPFSAELQHQAVDIFIPSLGIDFIFARTYRSRTGTNTTMGHGWTHSYDIHVQPLGGDLLIHDGTGRSDLFRLQTNGTWTADGFFYEVTSSNNRVKVKFPWLGEWEFNPFDASPSAGKISSSRDASGNTMTFAYDGMGRLTEIVDTLGRTNILAYGTNGLIETLTDFSGREVRYKLSDSTADLVSVRTAFVTGTPNGNDFPGGKTNTYTYTTGFADERLNHNLLSVTDPKGQTWLQVVYRTNLVAMDGNFDSVDYVQRGAHRTHLRRNAQTPASSNQFAVVKAILKDGVGNVTECFYDARRRCVRQLDYTGRAVPDVPTTQTQNRPINKLRQGDPDYFETRWAWNRDHLCTTVILPRGNSVQCIYERDFDAGASPIKKGDLRVFRSRTGNLITLDDQKERVWRFDHDPRFGSPNKGWDGTIKANGGVWPGTPQEMFRSGPRQTTSQDGSFSHGTIRRLHCWQFNRPTCEQLRKGWDGTIKGRIDAESANLKALPRSEVAKKMWAYFAISSTDPRGNVSTASYDGQGNLIECRVNNNSAPSIALQPVTRSFAYNSFGQLTAITNAPDGNGRRSVDTFEYYTSGAQKGFIRIRDLDSAPEDGLVLRTTFEYDPRGNVTRIIDPRTNDWLFSYNALDQCVRQQTANVCDPCGPLPATRIATDYFYDANDNLVQVDQENRDHTGALDAANPHWTTSCEYDALNRTTLIGHELTHVLQQRARYFYDANDNVTAVQSPEAVNGHDPNAVVSLQYDERDLLFREVDAPATAIASTTEWDYNANGRRKAQREQAEASGAKITTFEYDGFDQPASLTDPMGNVTEFAFDANGNLTFQRVLAETNDAPGSAGNLRYHEWRWNYDSLNRLVSSHGAFFDPATQAPIGDGESTHTYSYAPNGLLLSDTDDNGNTTGYAYDTAHRLGSITDAKANIVSLVRDRFDNIVTATSTERSDVGGPSQVFVENFSYDALNRLVSRSDNLGNTVNWSFDSRDNLVRALDSNTNLTGFFYDGLNRVTLAIADLNRDGLLDVVVDAAGTYIWDDNDRLASSTDDNTNTTIYAYDSRDRLVTATNPDGTMESLVWSPRSNLASRTDPNGTLVTNIYDLNDRLVSRQVTPGVGVAATTTFEVFAHDGAGRLVMASNDVSRVEAGYDSLGNRTRIITDGWQMLAAFDANGNRTSLTYPDGGVVVNGYDSLDRVSSVAFSSGAGVPPSSMATLSYDGPGRLSRIARANGINTRINWNGLQNPANSAGDFGWQQVSRVNHQVAMAGAVIDQRMAAYDRNQNRTLRAQTAPFHPGGDNTTNVWAYDAFDRLAQSSRVKGSTADYSRTYVLDAQGNRIATTNDGVPMLYTRSNTLPEPADFQMDQYTMTPFDAHQYDRNGNLISTLPLTPGGVPVHYAHDYANQLVEVACETGPGVFESVASYRYDALGRRISKTVYPDAPALPVTTQYIHGDDGDGILQARTGALIDSIVHLIDDRGLLGLRRSGGGVLYFHTDDLGNVLALTDAGGNVEERYEYDDYGAPEFLNSDGFPLVDGGGLPVTSSPAGNPFLFHGREWDAETGFYYQTRGVKENPLYQETGTGGNNPLFGGRYVDPQTGRHSTPVRNLPPLPGMCPGLSAYTIDGDNPWTGGSPDAMKKGTVKFFNEAKGFGRVAGGGGGEPLGYALNAHVAICQHTMDSLNQRTGRRRVEVLKSNKQGDPNANRLSAIGISGIRGHRDVGGYRSAAAGVWGKIKGDLTIEMERRSGGF